EHIRKIPTSELKVGMFVHKVESPDLSVDVMFHGYKVVSQKEIQTLGDYGIEMIYIDTSLGLDVGQSFPNDPVAESKSPVKLKALLVDDSRIIRQIELSVLTKIGGFEIAEAVDGLDAIGKLKANKYDIVLLDWMMPKMNGEQVLRAIRTVPGPNKDTPVLMVTAEVERRKILGLATLGISGYVTKPFTAELLEDKIKGILGKKKVVLG
ncbi:MAG: response regulator, partial [Nitrospinae bacterium]|nr:response regulator [Nitrospinota bacterium]